MSAERLCTAESVGFFFWIGVPGPHLWGVGCVAMGLWESTWFSMAWGDTVVEMCVCFFFFGGGGLGSTSIYNIYTYIVLVLRV